MYGGYFVSEIYIYIKKKKLNSNQTWFSNSQLWVLSVKSHDSQFLNHV